MYSGERIAGNGGGGLFPSESRSARGGCHVDFDERVGVYRPPPESGLMPEPAGVERHRYGNGVVVDGILRERIRPKTQVTNGYGIHGIICAKKEAATKYFIFFLQVLRLRSTRSSLPTWTTPTKCIPRPPLPTTSTSPAAAARDPPAPFS